MVSGVKVIVDPGSAGDCVKFEKVTALFGLLVKNGDITLFWKRLI